MPESIEIPDGINELLILRKDTKSKIIRMLFHNIKQNKGTEAPREMKQINFSAKVLKKTIMSSPLKKALIF